MTSNNSKGNESVRFKSSMSVDELDEILDKLLDYAEHDEYHYGCDINDGHVNYDTDRAKEAIHQYVTKRQIEELERLDSHYWGDDDKDDLVDSLIGEHLADRIKELEKQLEEWKQ